MKHGKPDLDLLRLHVRDAEQAVVAAATRVEVERQTLLQAQVYEAEKALELTRALRPEGVDARPPAATAGGVEPEVDTATLRTAYECLNALTTLAHDIYRRSAADAKQATEVASKAVEDSSAKLALFEDATAASEAAGQRLMERLQRDLAVLHASEKRPGEA